MFADNFKRFAADDHDPEAGERGQAIVLAMIVMFLAALIVVGVTVAVRSGSERGSDSRDRDTAFGSAQEGDKTYRAALGSGKAGESTRFVLTAAVLKASVDGSSTAAVVPVRCTAAEKRPCWMPDSETAFPRVDGTNIPAGDQITIRKEIQGTGAGSGLYAYWQMLSLVPPRLGVGCPAACVAPGGRVVAYMRAWVGPLGKAANTKPLITRTEFRAAQFSDYELVADGVINVGTGARIDGAVHSNGFSSSYQDQYKALFAAGKQVTFAAGVTCRSWARVTVSTSPRAGWFTAPGGCAALRTATGVPTVNLLRANTAIAAAQARCSAPYPLRVVCFNRAPNDARTYTVTLQANGTVTVAGVGTYSARDTSTGWGPGSQYGLVLVFNRSAHVGGTLGSNGRLTIMTGANAAGTGRISEPPSIYFDRPGSVGSNGSTATSVGFISANDIFGIESRACPLTIRAAMVASGGMLSFDPKYRGQLASGDRVCNAQFKVLGSIAGHNPPYLTNGIAGFNNRTYSYDANLFNNPPPMFPTVRNWDVQSSTLANIDCFDTSVHLANRTGCS